MSQVEPDHEQTDASDQSAEAGTDDARTGHAGVDAVVASLDGLDERPVAEHVAVFEEAHDRLRSALADAGSSDEPA